VKRIVLLTAHATKLNRTEPNRKTLLVSQNRALRIAYQVLPG